MKRLSLVFALLVTTLILNAQDESKSSTNDINTIFGKGGKTTIGWFVGINPGYTQFDKKDVWLGGISGGMIINHNFSMGVVGRGWTNHDGMYYPNITDTVGAYLEGGYGGLLLEYTLFPKSIIHVSFPLIIGGGGASYNTNSYHQYDEDNDCGNGHNSIDSDGFFVIEPGINAEVNILKFMKFNAGISYRYTAGVELINTPTTLMNNFTVNFGLKFGKF